MRETTDVGSIHRITSRKFYPDQCDLARFNFIVVWTAKTGRIRRVKYWGIIASRLKKAGWSVGYVSTIDCHGRTMWIADAHRDGQRFIVRADEKLAAFVELERAIHQFAVGLIS